MGEQNAQEFRLVNTGVVLAPEVESRGRKKGG